MLNFCNNSVDWDATGSMLSGIGTIGGAVVVFITAIMARSTFSDWKKQKITERRLVHAEDILAAAYRVRSDLKACRSRFMSAYETDNAKEHLKTVEGFLDVSDERQEKLARAQAYYNRINNAKEDREALYRVVPFAKAHWGEELEGALLELDRQFWLIRCNADEMVDQDKDTPKEDRVRVNQALGADDRSTDDPISKATIDCIATIEKICLPVLRFEEAAGLQVAVSWADLLRGYATVKITREVNEG